MLTRPGALVLSLLLGLSTVDHAAGQCGLELSAASPQAALVGTGECFTTWDPDGTGPLPALLVTGGENLTAGSLVARQRVIAWDGAAWQSIGDGPGTSGAVRALTSWNGLLVAGGNFSGGGNTNIATWNGVAWQPLGTGLATIVTALCVWNGLLVAVDQGAIRTWNGVAWTTLPSPPVMYPNAIVSYQGLLCVGGYGPTGAGGALARWNGTTWLAPILAQNPIECLAVRFSLAIGGTDVLYAGGAFTSINGTPAAHIASTSGGAAFAWSQVGGGLPNTCSSLHVHPLGLTGTVVVATVSNSPAPLQLSGGSFVPMGSANIDKLIRHAGSYFAFSDSNDDLLLQYDGANWNPVHGPGLLGIVRAATQLGSDSILGGSFGTISGVPMNHVARWNGTTFQPLGAGFVGNSVDALLTLGNGDVIAGGDFTASGATATSRIARWNGTAWSALGSGTSGQVLALARLPNGDVIAGGTFTSASGVTANNVARWNGSAWSALGTGMNGAVRALAVRSDGRLFAGGSFTIASGVTCNRIAQWNGTAWLPVGTGCDNTVHALAARAPAEIVAAGEFTTAGGVASQQCARWTGSVWVGMSMGSSPLFPRAIAVLPTGNVIAGRGPTGSQASGLAYWNGGAWTTIGTGLTGPPSAAYLPTVHTIVHASDSSLLLGGDFVVADGEATGSLGVVSTPCPATASAYGSGCSSAAGVLSLAADTLPWVGTSFRTTTTGTATGSLCLGVIGLTQLSIPLPSLLPEGQPGCSLLTALDVILPLATGFGTASSSFELANDPSLIGAPFFQQTIPLEFDALGAITAVRSSDALALVIGTF